MLNGKVLHTLHSVVSHVVRQQTAWLLQGQQLSDCLLVPLYWNSTGWEIGVEALQLECIPYAVLGRDVVPQGCGQRAAQRWLISSTGRLSAGYM